MRMALKDINTTKKYTAIFNKFSTSKNGKIETLLLTDIRNNNVQVTDHLWSFNKEVAEKTYKFMKTKLENNTIISFKADVKEYYKRKNGKMIKDYCLTNIHDVRIINRVK